MSSKESGFVDKVILSATLVVLTLLLSAFIFFTEVLGRFFNTLYQFFIFDIGILYQVGTILCFGIVLYFIFGRYHQIRFGGEDAKPEFNYLSWLTMFFCSGMGSALLYWSMNEWPNYYGAGGSLPFGKGPEEIETLLIAVAYPIFHRAAVPWAVYIILAYPMGYMYWNMKKKNLNLSTSCYRVLGVRNTTGWRGSLIDFLLIFGLLGATASSFASSTPLLSQLISKIFHLPLTLSLNVVIFSIWILIFSLSVFLGLNRGIKQLSNLNIFLVGLLCLAILILGPGKFILDFFFDVTGTLLFYFPKMLFSTESLRPSTLPQEWTIFNWAWYFAYAPYMGMFTARISRGRTFRELGIAVLFIGSLGSAIVVGILAGNSVYLTKKESPYVQKEISSGESYEYVTSPEGEYNFYDVFSDKEGLRMTESREVIPTAHKNEAVIGTLTTLPFSGILLFLFTVTIFIFGATSLDSSAYTLSLISLQQGSKREEPPLWLRLSWAFFLSTGSIVVISLGGLVALKTSSLLTGFPIMIFVFISLASLFKALRENE